MSQKNNPLELYIVEKLKEIGIDARVTKGSGCGNELLDVSNEIFYVECRQDHNSKNFIIRRKEDWLDSIKKLPINSHKELLIVKENGFGEKMIAIEAEAFFRILGKAYKELEEL